MPENMMFAPLKNERLPKRSFRRVAHSSLNVVQATDSGMAFASARIKNIESGAAHPDLQAVKAGVAALKPSSVGSGMVGGATALGATWGNVAGTGGMVAGAMTLAGYAGSAAAAVAVFSGPQVAVAAGVVGLVALAAATYSNREEAHAFLTGYCWSLIDDVPPTPLNNDVIEKAGQSALTLLRDGQNQIALMQSKLNSAKADLNAFNEKIERNNRHIRTFGNGKSVSQAAVAALINENITLIEDAMKQGGEINNYARRVVHLGNYLQAPGIVAVAMKQKIMPSSLTQEVDFFAGTEIGNETRKRFATLEQLYKQSMRDPWL